MVHSAEPYLEISNLQMARHLAACRQGCRRYGSKKACATEGGGTGTVPALAGETPALPRIAVGRERGLSTSAILRHNGRMHLRLITFAAVFTVLALHSAEAAPPLQDEPERWRAQRRIIDLHQHIGGTTQHLARAVRIMDAVGIGLAVNLSGATVTPGRDGAPSEFERIQRLSDALFPGRFLQYFSLDYAGWDAPDFAERAARQVEEAHRLGAAGLKEFKRLGLFLRDGQGKLIKVDDPKLDPVWKRCGELGMPVSIHVADPKAFWLPYNERNERWKELKDHPSWWFGDTNKYPSFEELLAALNRVIERHPKTTFVCVHFANNAEDLEWVDRSLSQYPNMMADLAARIPELGRHDPARVRQLFTKHQDRIFFATDFQVYNRMILGSSGPEPPPSEADAEVFFAKEWRWLETKDNDWEHMTYSGRLEDQLDWPVRSRAAQGVLRQCPATAGSSTASPRVASTADQPGLYSGRPHRRRALAHRNARAGRQGLARRGGPAGSRDRSPRTMDH